MFSLLVFLVIVGYKMEHVYLVIVRIYLVDFELYVCPLTYHLCQLNVINIVSCLLLCFVCYIHTNFIVQ